MTARLVAIAGLTAGLMLSAPWALMLADRDPPIGNVRTTVETPVVAAGQPLVVRYRLDRLRDCATQSERTIVDGDGEVYRLPATSRISLGWLGHQDYKSVVPIPVSAAPGKARYRVIVAYTCNVVHRAWPIVLTVADVDFEIAPPVAKAAAAPP